MGKINISNGNNFTDKFIDEYLTNGMGAMPKSEIDILVMYLLLEYGDIENKSNQELSILLQTTEATIKRLRYKARLKYPIDEDYVKREFLIVLSRSQFELDKNDEANINKMKILFAMEDDYLRHEIQGRLKAKGMFADTSFNREIIKIECGSLVAVIREIYGDKVADNFQSTFTKLSEPTTDEKIAKLKKSMGNFILETIKAVFSTAAAAGIRARLGIA